MLLEGPAALWQLFGPLFIHVHVVLQRRQTAQGLPHLGVPHQWPDISSVVELRVLFVQPVQPCLMLRKSCGIGEQMCVSHLRQSSPPRIELIV